ncbi:MAG: TonB family protein [Candidatus Entotheonellia bacterium]
MQRSEIEDRVWPELAAGTVSSGGATAPGVPARRWSALYWGISCTVHLLLLVAVGVLTRNIITVPQAPPIRVSILPALAPSAESLLAEAPNAAPQARMPERRPPDAALSQVSPVDPDPALPVTPRPPLPALQEPERAVAPLTPENTTPESIEVMPEVKMAREPPPLSERPRNVVPDLWSPDAMTPVVPMPPPVVTRSPVPRLPQTSPARELPKRGRPPTTFDDAVVARIPPAGRSRRDSPPAVAPDTPGKAQPTPQTSLPRSTDARYGQNPTPSYPAEARRRGWEGTVLLSVEILENGRPERITIKQSSGHSILDEAALGAVGRWTFIPAQRDGKPVRSFAEVPIVFALRNGR